MSYDITALRRKVVARYPFFGSVAAGLQYEERPGIRSTAGNGKVIFYNPDWLAGLQVEDQIFALAHEICHVAFQHIRRSRGRDGQVWKQATDAVVNQLLARDGLAIPAGYVDFPEAIDYDAESYYEILMEHKLAMELIEGNMQRPQGAPGEGPEDEGEGMQQRRQEQEDEEDDHSLWEEAAEQQAQEEADQEEELRRQLEQIKEVMEASQEPEGGEGEDTQDGDGDGDEDEEAEKALVSQKVSQSGNEAAPDLRQIERIGQAAPIIDWRMILRDTVNYGVDWSMEHAVLEDGIVRPVLEERPMPETEIVVDTSWSVDDDLLRNFLRECKNILQVSRLWVGCFDTVFYGFHEIRTEEDIENMPFDGGGGTDFDVAAGAFSLRVDNRIVFTDGEAEMPKQPLDAVWMVYGGEEIDPPGGRVIHITEEQLARLKERR